MGNEYFTASGTHKREQPSRAKGCQRQGQASTTVWNKLSQAGRHSTGVEQDVHCSRTGFGWSKTCLVQHIRYMYGFLLTDQQCMAVGVCEPTPDATMMGGKR